MVRDTTINRVSPLPLNGATFKIVASRDVSKGKLGYELHLSCDEHLGTCRIENIVVWATSNQCFMSVLSFATVLKDNKNITCNMQHVPTENYGQNGVRFLLISTTMKIAQ